MIAIFLTLIYNHILLFWPDGSWSELHASDYMPDYTMRWVTFGVSWGFGLTILIIQKLILEPVSNRLVKAYPHIKWL
jgi:hypothetical protein